MSAFLPLLISWLQEYGYPALWLTIFCAAIGLPLPIGFVLLGAGAFAALGDFNLALLIFISISASVAGDTVGYWIGRSFGSKVFLWLEHQDSLRFIKADALARSRDYFQRHGGWAVFLSRFLFSAFGSPINLLAGAELYSYRRFLIYDILGEAIGASMPLVLGFAFETSWEEVGEVMGTVSLLIIAFLVTLYLASYLLMLARRIRAKRATSLHVERQKKSPLVIRGVGLGKEGPDTMPL